jgi:hypothetical protein
MKLNLGCGQHKIDGYVNVDAIAAAQPDVVHNLEITPWPWPDSSVDEIVMRHSLEHMGAETKTFFAIMQELYRVCRDGAPIYIHVPDPRHNSYLSDPTHVRPIIPGLFAAFSRRNNEHWQEAGAANTPLALYLGVDFQTTHIETNLDEPYASLYRKNAISQEELDLAIKLYNNVVIEYAITLKVIKPAH